MSVFSETLNKREKVIKFALVNCASSFHQVISSAEVAKNLIIPYFCSSLWYQSNATKKIQKTWPDWRDFFFTTSFRLKVGG